MPLANNLYIFSLKYHLPTCMSHLKNFTLSHSSYTLHTIDIFFTYSSTLLKSSFNFLILNIPLPSQVHHIQRYYTISNNIFQICLSQCPIWGNFNEYSIPQIYFILPIIILLFLFQITLSDIIFSKCYSFFFFFHHDMELIINH